MLTSYARFQAARTAGSAPIARMRSRSFGSYGSFTVRTGYDLKVRVPFDRRIECMSPAARKKIPVFVPCIQIDTMKHLVDAFDVGWLGMGNGTLEFEERIAAWLGLEGRYVV